MYLEDIRKRRLSQLTAGIQLMLIVTALLHILLHFYFEATVMFATVLLLHTVHLATQKHQLNKASSILVSLIFIVILIFLLTGAGLRDSALYCLPGLIIFASMVGQHRLPYLILTMSVILCLTLGTLYSIGWLEEPELQTNFETGATLSLILLITSFGIITLHKDLLIAAKVIKKENQRVIESQRALEHMAHHDALTNLPNRHLAKDRFTHAVAKTKRDREKYLIAVFYLDLDDFKSVNDTLGHEAGDQLLIHIAKQLKAACRKQDTVCRLGGDEFLVIAEGLEETWQAINMANKLLRAINQSFEINDIQVSCATSIGIAMAPIDGDTFKDLLKKADLAMYQSKSNGRNQFHFFNETQQLTLERRLQITTELSNAIRNDELSLLLQPQIRLSDNSITGAEALLRWHSPKLGEVSPDEFIPISEQSGHIIDIGNWVINSAIATSKALRYLSPSFQVAVNVSVVQFKHSGFASHVAKMLEEANLPPDALDIEITESLLADHEGSLNQQLKMLHESGIHLSIDDFGTGYSNLGYLKRMSIGTLKIDRSFIHDLSHNESNQTIVKAILQICAGLGITSVAEGVEEQETADLLKQWGCTTGQGFYWAKPLTVEALMKRLKPKAAVHQRDTFR